MERSRARSSSFYTEDDDGDDSADSLGRTPMPDFLNDNTAISPPPAPSNMGTTPMYTGTPMMGGGVGDGGEGDDVDHSLDDNDQAIEDRRRSRSFFSEQGEIQPACLPRYHRTRPPDANPSLDRCLFRAEVGPAAAGWRRRSP